MDDYAEKCIGAITLFLASCFLLSSCTEATVPWQLSFIDDSALAIHSAEEKMKVAVIDSGFCDSFPSLFDPDIVSKGYDFIDDDEDTSSTNDHASLVAGLISSFFMALIPLWKSFHSG